MTSRAKGGKQNQQQPEEPDYDQKMKGPLDEQELEALYAWVDGVPLSRPKRNISRDFSDGVLVAEIMKHFFPKLVEMHNYTPASATSKKVNNWNTLNRYVFSRLHFELDEEVINELCSCKPGMIEKVLLMLQVKIESAKYAQRHHNDKPEADQHQPSPGRGKGGGGNVMRLGMDNKGGKGSKVKHIRDTVQTELNAQVELNGSLQAKIQDREVDQKALKPAAFKGVPKKRIGQIVEPDMVPRYVVEEKEQEVLSRDETIQIMNAKIKKLEHLLHLKDMRINELVGDVKSYAGHDDYTGYSQNNYDYRVYNKR